MIFQSLGSNYTLMSAFKILFSRGDKKDHQAVIKWLENHYGGIAYLYAKGRDGLAAAIEGINASSVAVNGVTCSVLIDAVQHAGSNVIYIDIANDGNLRLSELDKSLRSAQPPRAIIIQNTYGNTCDIAKIESLAKKHKAIIIEDLAHCLGQKYPDGREVGTVGDIVMLSFGRDKIIDVVNGGALIIREPLFLKKIKGPSEIRPARNQIQDRFYPILTWLARRTYRIGLGKLIVYAMYKFHLAEHSADGGIHPEYDMPDWQAHYLLGELEKLSQNLDHRTKIATIYREQLSELIPTENASLRVPLLVRGRQKLIEYLAENHYLLADTWYDTPIGPKRKYQKIDYPEDTNKNSIQLARHIINLPTHVNINERQARKLATLIKEYYD